MPWRSMKNVPASLKKLDGVRLTLAQANAVARMADDLAYQGSAKNPWAVSIAAFKKSHLVRNGRWVEKRR